eukprot:12388029-Heterocapsa_arctica.AAC.1
MTSRVRRAVVHSHSSNAPAPYGRPGKRPKQATRPQGPCPGSCRLPDEKSLTLVKSAYSRVQATVKLGFSVLEDLSPCSPKLQGTVPPRADLLRWPFQGKGDALLKVTWNGIIGVKGVGRHLCLLKKLLRGPMDTEPYLNVISAPALPPLPGTAASEAKSTAPAGTE